MMKTISHIASIRVRTLALSLTRKIKIAVVTLRLSINL